MYAKWMRSGWFGVAIAAWLGCACSREDGQGGAVPLLSSGEAARADEAKVAPYLRQIDRWTAEVQRLIAAAEAASGDTPRLVAIRREYLALQDAAKREMAAAETSLSADQKRALQSRYSEQLAPLVGRLQPLLFPALLVDLPQGATPNVAATTVTPTAKE